jgi:hypothetical protein
MCIQMTVTIDLAMPLLALPLLDIGMILLIVVLPAVMFLMAPNSNKTDVAKRKSSTDEMKLQGEFSEPSKVHKYDGRFVKQLAALPHELGAEVAEYLELSDAASVSSSCRHLQGTLHTLSVWQTLGRRYGAHTTSIKNQSVNQSKDEVRLAARNMESKCIKDLAIEIKRYPPGASAAPTGKVLSKASRFVQQLLPSDCDLAMELCDLLRPCLSCHGFQWANEAKEFLQSAQRSAVPWVALQDLESSYGHGVLQQNLFESCMQEHENMMEAQLCELEASIAEESKTQIDYDLDFLLSM